MKIRVQFFATLADAAKVRSLELELGEGSTLAQLWDRLASLYPDLTPHAGTLLRAVNEEFSKPDTKLREGDEVAFFPPVSGG